MAFLSSFFRKLLSPPRELSIYVSPNLSIIMLFRQKSRILLSWLLYQLRYFFRDRVALKTTRIFIKSKKNKIALILGNGPSANDLNFSEIQALSLNQKIDIYIVNFSLLEERIRDLNPQFLVLSDTETFPNANDARTSKLWTLIRSNQKMKVITPTSWHNVEIFDDCQKSTCLHFVDSSLEGFMRNISPLKARGYSSMTAYKALAYAVSSGYVHNYIAGIDNSNFRSLRIDSKNRLIQSSNHLVEDYVEEMDMSNFYPKGLGDYFYDFSVVHLSLRTCFRSFPITNLGISSEVDFFQKSLSISETVGD